MKCKFSRNFRWVIIALIFVITITNYIDRASMAYAINDIKVLFHLDDDAVGLILGAFGIGYAITTFFGGIAVDRYGTRKVLAISVFLWSLAIIFTGGSSGFLIIFLMRILLGVAVYDIALDGRSNINVVVWAYR